jgi:hypothetical protein
MPVFLISVISLELWSFESLCGLFVYSPPRSKISIFFLKIFPQTKDFKFLAVKVYTTERVVSSFQNLWLLEHVFFKKSMRIKIIFNTRCTSSANLDARNHKGVNNYDALL